MNIKKTFLSLTSKTYPYGFEHELVGFLPKSHTKDDHGNYYYKIGNSRTVFTCHLDTACKDQVNVKHIIDGNLIKTDGKSILGADDKAGMTVLLYMIEKNVPGLYCFFIGEEVGCIGSGLASLDKSFLNYDRIVSFDRRGTGSVITFQSSKRCCSDIFAKSLSSELNKYGLSMSPDDTGVYTDSAEFTSVIPECTNISVGYYKEHTFSESQDIKHLSKLCNAAVLVNWESLPTKRNPKITEYKPYKAVKGYDRYDVDRYTNKKHSGRNDNIHSNPWKYRDDYDWYEFKNNGKKKGRVYYNDLDNDITDSFIESELKGKKYYETLKQIIFDDNITKKDFIKLRDQYLDMKDPNDMDFYLEMKELLN